MVSRGKSMGITRIRISGPLREKIDEAAAFLIVKGICALREGDGPVIIVSRLPPDLKPRLERFLAAGDEFKFTTSGNWQIISFTECPDWAVNYLRVSWQNSFGTPLLLLANPHVSGMDPVALVVKVISGRMALPSLVRELVGRIGFGLLQTFGDDFLESFGVVMRRDSDGEELEVLCSRTPGNQVSLKLEHVFGEKFKLTSLEEG